MTRIVGSRQRGLTLLGGLAHLHINTPYMWLKIKTATAFDCVNYFV